jgi:hypothetical protein
MAKYTRFTTASEAIQVLRRNNVFVNDLAKRIERKTIGLRLQGAVDYLVNEYGYRIVDKLI